MGNTQNERLPKASRNDDGFAAQAMDLDGNPMGIDVTTGMRVIKESGLANYKWKSGDDGFLREAYDAIHTGQLKTALTMAKSFAGRPWNRGLSESLVSTDFDTLMDGSIRTHLMDAWKEIQWNFLDVLDVVSYEDYEEHKLAAPSELEMDDETANTQMSGTLPAVPENKGFHEATMSEKYETIQISDYGAVFSITARALAKDDKGVIPKMPKFLGRAAKRTVSAAVCNLYEQNTLAGPTMTEDSAAAFSTTRGNLAASSLSLANAKTGWNALAAETAYAGGAAGRVMGLTPDFIVVPPGLELTANEIFGGDARMLISAESDEGYRSNVNLLAGRCAVRVWREISDTTAWWLMTSPANFTHGQIAFLNNVQEPIIEVQGGIGPDLANPLGRKYRVRTAFGVGLADWRGVYVGTGGD